MAVAADAVSTASGDGVTSISWSHTCTGADRAIFPGMSHNGTISSVTYAGVSSTLVNESTVQSPYKATWYKLSAPASGANTTVFNFSASSTGAGGAFSVTGAHQTTASLTSGAAVGGGTDTAPTITITSATNDMVVAITASASAFSPVAPGTGSTELWDHAPNFISSWAAREDGAASVVVNGTANSFEDWNIAGFNIVAAAAPASGQPLRKRTGGIPFVAHQRGVW